MVKNNGAKVRLEDVGLKVEKKYLILSLVFIGMSVVLANVLSYWLYDMYSLIGALTGSVIGASVGVAGNYWLLKSNRLVKTIGAELKGNVTLRDSLSLKKVDKDGNLVEEREIK